MDPPFLLLTSFSRAPAIEDQAVDRVHRLGQKKPTRVFRLVMDQSIEEKTLEIQKIKRGLMVSAIKLQTACADTKFCRTSLSLRRLGNGTELDRDGSQISNSSWPDSMLSIRWRAMESANQSKPSDRHWAGVSGIVHHCATQIMILHLLRESAAE